jgi:hypothetical protein
VHIQVGSVRLPTWQAIVDASGMLGCALFDPSIGLRGVSDGPAQGQLRPAEVLVEDARIPIDFSHDAASLEPGLGFNRLNRACPHAALRLYRSTLI